MIRGKREKLQGEATGVAISNRVVRESHLGKVIFEHRSERNEGMNQWNLGNKPCRQRENKCKAQNLMGGSVAYLIQGIRRKLAWLE